MIRVNKLNDSMTGAVDGKQFGIAFSASKYEMLLKLQKDAEAAKTPAEYKAIMEQASKLVVPDFQEIVDTATPFLRINPETGAYYLRIGNTDSKMPLPKALKRRIEESLSMSMDITPLVKAWTRLLRGKQLNPEKAKRFAWYIDEKYTNQELVSQLIGQGLSDKIAVERATTFQVPITMEGLACTYKVSREITKKWVKDEEANGGKKLVERRDYSVDEITGLVTYKNTDFVEDRIFEPAVQGQTGDAFKCTNILSGESADGHIIRVGHIHELDSWDKVNCNDNTSCVKGLQVGNLDYIRGYQGQGTETHNVFVDPMDIGAIVQDNSGAIRVRRYFVHSSFAGVNRSMYHSSHFASITDKEYSEMVKEAIAENQKRVAEDSAAWTALM
jgi:hypothetical protein